MATAALVTSCTSEGERAPAVEPTGPPAVELDRVQRHAREFDAEIADRPAGSQNEQAASIYLLGHLQQAGYIVLLDAVPVGNLVRSTNVIAEPPSGDDPTVVVAVRYDTSEGYNSSGGALGLFLEAARALRVAVPGHSVEFVALGAEVSTNQLGSRRLIRQLLDDDLDPIVILIENVSEKWGFSVRGGAAPELYGIAQGLGVSVPASPTAKSLPRDLPWIRSGLTYAAVSGTPGDVARVLLEYLQERGR
jgi:hypothetical protein